MSGMLVPLKYLVGINECSLPETTDPDYRFHYVDVGAVGQGELVLPPQEMRFRDAPSRARRLVRAGDTIVSTVRTYLRAVWPVPAGTDNLVVSTGFAVLTPRTIEPRYFSWWTRSDCFIDEIAARSVGVSYPAINASELGALRVRVPSLREQQAIACFLEDRTFRINALIKRRTAVREQLRERARAVIDAFLNRELDWSRVAPLRHLLQEVDIRGTCDEEVLSTYRDHGVVPKASRSDNFNKTPDDVSGYKLVMPGDVVVNKMKAWQGSVAVSRYRGIVSPDYLVARPQHELLAPTFLHHLLRSTRLVDEYRLRSKGIRPSQWRLYWTDLSAIKIPLPSVDLQRELAEAIETRIDHTHRADIVIERQIQLLHEHRRVLITAAVTGALGVPGVAS